MMYGETPFLDEGRGSMVQIYYNVYAEVPMGQFFERILVQEKGIMPLFVLVQRAMEAIGYVPGEEGQGVSLSYRQAPESEWFDFSSPLLEQGAETAEPLKKALSKAFRTPLLDLTCVDSDFVICRLIDEEKGTDTAASLNEPYEDLGLGQPDYDAWAASCKKKWKCKPAQLRSVFEGRYTFAEEGLEQLSKLLHFAPVDEIDPDSFTQATDWFVPRDGSAPQLRVLTLAEALPPFMEREYAAKFEQLGFRRYRGSPLRWHKLVGEPGREVLLSMVFTLYHGFEIDPIYGAQPLYCPLTLSDKYYPLHDDWEYWREAQFEYYWKFGHEPMIDVSDRIPKVRCAHEFNKLPPCIDELMLPELSAIRSLADCRAAYLRSKTSERRLWNLESKVRRWIEAALADDEEDAQRWFEVTKKDIERPEPPFGRNVELERAMVAAYAAGGCPGLVAYLKETVYRDNLRRLKRAGIIE